MNICVIGGNLGADPEMRYLPDGRAITVFNMANSTYGGKDLDGKTKYRTTWFRVNVWGPLAETVNAKLTKGNKVIVTGRVTQEFYTDKAGNEKASLKITANDIEFLVQKGVSNTIPIGENAEGELWDPSDELA